MDAYQQMKGTAMVQDDNGFVEHCAGILVGAGALIASLVGLLKWMKPKGLRDSKKMRDYIEGIEAIHELNSVMSGTVEDGHADRVILFVGHDGGGMPMAAEPYYISALHWNGANCAKLQTLKSISVDPIYCTMILDLLRNKKVNLTTDEMHPGILKDIYESEMVIEAEVHLLGIRHNKLYFISFSRINGGFRNGDSVRLEIAAQRISQIIMK